jgi:microcompartment protein CcmK/EutM
MAKPPPEESFNVTFFGIPKELLGASVAAQAKVGDFPFRTELVTTVVGFRKNEKSDINPREFLETWIKDHPSFKAIEAVKAVKEAGGSNTSTYPALAVMVGKGLLKKVGDGLYARADVKALAPPRKKRTEKPHKTFDKRGEDVILSYARRNHGRFNTAKLVELFAAEGRARNSVYASIDALLKDRMVKRTGDRGSGQYVLLSKGQSARMKKIATDKPVGNGVSVEPVEEVTNG